MKKLLIIASLMLAASLTAKVIYDPATNTLYSEPRSGINPTEYVGLCIACEIIEKNIVTCNGGMIPPKRVVLEQFIHYLNSIKTPTALRLIADLQEDKVFYPNGTYMRTFWDYGKPRDLEDLIEIKETIEENCPGIKLPPIAQF